MQKIGGERAKTWEGLSNEERFEIWEERLNQVISNIDSERKKELLKLFKSNFTFNNFTTGKINDIYYKELKPEMNIAFEKRELEYIFESIHPYQKNYSNSLNLLKESWIKTATLRGDPVKVQGDTFTGSGCDCRWGDCGPLGDTMNWTCCDKGGCSSSSVGCGFLWLQSCNSICVEDSSYSCN